MEKQTLKNRISIAKDLVVLLRDAAIIILAVLLIVFPIKFNSILVKAGFEEGDVVGFKWKSNLKNSTIALERAYSSIDSLEFKNTQLILALHEAEKKLNDSDLKTKLKKLEDQNLKIQQSTRETQADVLNVIDQNTPLIESIKSTSNKDDYKIYDYTVGLQTLGISNTVRNNLNVKLKEKGYRLDKITYSYNKNDKPSWFASQPTVFYYSNLSKQQAQELAAYMTNLTSVTFKVQRGGGLGVDPAKKHLTFFVHYVK